jgi:hypothetical protein
MRVLGAGTPQSKLPPIHEPRRRSKQKKNLRSPGKASGASSELPRLFSGLSRDRRQRLPAKATAERLRVFRLDKAEHNDVAVIAARGVRQCVADRAAEAPNIASLFFWAADLIALTVSCCGAWFLFRHLYGREGSCEQLRSAPRSDGFPGNRTRATTRCRANDADAGVYWHHARYSFLGDRPGREPGERAAAERTAAMPRRTEARLIVNSQIPPKNRADRHR